MISFIKKLFGIGEVPPVVEVKEDRVSTCVTVGTSTSVTVGTPEVAELVATFSDRLQTTTDAAVKEPAKIKVTRAKAEPKAKKVSKRKPKIGPVQ